MSSQEIFDRLYSLKNHLSSSSYLFDSLEFQLNSMASESDMTSIERVEAFFEANKFRGFVINVKSFNKRNNITIGYEALFTPKSSKELITTNFNISNHELITIKNQLLQLLTNFIVSTDFDTKERQFSNYGCILDQNSDPALLMDFDPVDRDFEFWIIRTNPSG